MLNKRQNSLMLMMLMVALAAAPSRAIPCSGAFYLFTMEDVKNFIGQNCQTVGALSLLNVSGLTSLSGFGGLLQITGTLQITGNQDLLTLSGMDNLQTVNSITVNNNPLLTETGGFPSLKTAGFIQFSANPNQASVVFSVVDKPAINLATMAALTQISFPQMTTSNGGITITNCQALTNLDGLASLTSILCSSTQACLGLTLSNLPNLVSVSGLANVRNMTNFAGGYQTAIQITIQQTGLKSLAPFNPAIALTGVTISSNPSLLTIDAFKSLQSITNMNVQGNNALLTLGGFQSLQKLNSLSIFNNNALNNLTGLETVTSLSYPSFTSYYQLQIQNNYALTSIDALSGVTSFQNIGLIITSNPKLSYCLDTLCNLLQLNPNPPSFNVAGNGPYCAPTYCVTTSV